MNDDHKIEFVPQSIADGWQALCSCGKWKTFVSYYDFNTKDKIIAELERQHQEHVALNHRIPGP